MWKHEKGKQITSIVSLQGWDRGALHGKQDARSFVQMSEDKDESKWPLSFDTGQLKTSIQWDWKTHRGRGRADSTLLHDRLVNQCVYVEGLAILRTGTPERIGWGHSGPGTLWVMTEVELQISLGKTQNYSSGSIQVLAVVLSLPQNLPNQFILG